MIIITGLQRSGTSLSAQLLSAIGLDFGNSELLVPPDEWNPKGYYENVDVLVLNDKLALGKYAPARQYRTKMPAQRSLGLRIAMSVLRGRYLLAGQQGGLVTERAQNLRPEMNRVAALVAHHPVKDPRFSITIGEWRKYAPIKKILYCYRHPYEVTLSLKKRYRLPQPLGYRLWNEYLSVFFEQAQGLPVIMLDYNQLFGPSYTSEVKRIFNFAGVAYNETEAQRLKTSIIDEDLWRSRGEHRKLPPLIEQKYEQLKALHPYYDVLKPLESAISPKPLLSKSPSRQGTAITPD